MAERVIAAFAIAGVLVWAGYQARDYEARQAHLQCSAYFEDGRPLLETYIDTAGRLRCLYRYPVPIPRGKRT